MSKKYSHGNCGTSLSLNSISSDHCGTRCASIFDLLSFDLKFLQFDLLLLLSQVLPPIFAVLLDLSWGVAFAGLRSLGFLLLCYLLLFILTLALLTFKHVLEDGLGRHLSQFLLE